MHPPAAEKVALTTNQLTDQFGGQTPTQDSQDCVYHPDGFTSEPCTMAKLAASVILKGMKRSDFWPTYVSGWKMV